MKGLLKLCLENNDIADFGAKALSKALESNHNMVAIYLENNALTDESSVDIALMLSEKPKLKKLNLSYN